MKNNSKKWSSLLRFRLWHQYAPYIKVGGGTLGAQVIALLSMKCWALLVGVSGIGMAGVLLSWAGLLGTVIGFGLSTGLMRWGPELLTTGDKNAWIRLLATAWWLWRCLAVLCLLLGALCIAGGCLGVGRADPVLALTVPLIAICQSATTLLTAEVNVRQLPGRLALMAPAGAFGQAAGALPWLMVFGLVAVPQALSCGAGLGLLLSWISARRARPQAVLPRLESYECKQLLRFGGPWMFALLGGAGVQSLLCVLVASKMGEISAGLYRAGTTVSVQYLAVLMGTLAQIYAPKVASLRNDQKSLILLVDRQSILTVHLVGVASLCLAIFIDPALSFLYSRDFLPARGLAVWYLVGMPLRAVSWCLGYIALTKAPGWALLIGELFTGLIWLSTAWLLMRTSLSLTGIGVAFVITYLFYLIVMSVITWRYAKIRIQWNSIAWAVAWSLLIGLAAVEFHANMK